MNSQFPSAEVAVQHLTDPPHASNAVRISAMGRDDCGFAEGRDITRKPAKTPQKLFSDVRPMGAVLQSGVLKLKTSKNACFGRPGLTPEKGAADAANLWGVSLSPTKRDAPSL